MYYQFHFTKLDEGQDELLIALLEDHATGFEQCGNELYAYTKDNNAFLDLLCHYKLLETETSIIEEKNWNEQWEQSFEPVTIYVKGEPFVYIRASFHAHDPNCKFEIEITPKMSFGTGHHATTYLMIEEMAEFDFSEKQVIDFGTGTGLLAILSEKSGASSVIAIDNDEWSIDNAKENISLNNCSHITLQNADTIEVEDFADIILANINLNIILANLNKIFAALKYNGILLLSGMLVNDKVSITGELNNAGLNVVHIHEKNNWIVVCAEKVK